METKGKQRLIVGVNYKLSETSDEIKISEMVKISRRQA